MPAHPSAVPGTRPDHVAPGLVARPSGRINTAAGRRKP